jgi:hypothetical protein
MGTCHFPSDMLNYIDIARREESMPIIISRLPGGLMVLAGYLTECNS